MSNEGWPVQPGEAPNAEGETVDEEHSIPDPLDKELDNDKDAKPDSSSKDAKGEDAGIEIVIDDIPKARSRKS